MGFTYGTFDLELCKLNIVDCIYDTLHHLHLHSQSASMELIFANITTTPTHLPLPLTLNCECWILALLGNPKRNQIRHRAVREAGLHAARSRADPSHRVLGALRHVQGRTPETGALRTHGQWTDLFYIRTDSFSYFILVSMSTWSVRLVGRSSLVPSPILRTDACVRCWATSPLSVPYFLVSLFISLGLR